MEIDGEIVNDLSGPISFELLEPKKETFYKYPGMYPPVVLLFGDAHWSYTATCEDPTYKISNSNFLKLLNQLSTTEYPIDMNIEHFTLVGLDLDIPDIKKYMKIYKI